MNVALIFQQFVTTYWYLIPLLVLASIIKKPWFNDWMGEAMLNLSARLFLDKSNYHLMRNITLPTEDGTTQIDHIIVSPFGVFMLETKNVKGRIYDNANQRQWTQKIYRHNKKFQNPMHHNYKHMKTQQSLLGLDDEQVCSLVAFVGDSTFKTEMPENVTQGGKYIRFIKSQTEHRLSDAEVQDVVKKIGSGRLAASFRRRRAHTAPRKPGQTYFRASGSQLT